MKKIYQQPTAQVIKLHVKESLLLGSLNDNTVNEGEFGLVFTRRRMWEEEEEDY